jgi:hypothetical protein
MNKITSSDQKMLMVHLFSTNPTSIGAYLRGKKTRNFDYLIFTENFGKLILLPLWVKYTLMYLSGYHGCLFSYCEAYSVTVFKELATASCCKYVLGL